MSIVIPKFGWTQVAGDMNPGTHGGTIAQADGETIDLVCIQPVRAYVGDMEASDVGFPFWTRTAIYDADDIAQHSAEACRSADVDPTNPDTCEVACAMLDYGTLSDEGLHGWARDIIPGTMRVKWWGSLRPNGWRYLAEEDRDFRAMVREQLRKPGR